MVMSENYQPRLFGINQSNRDFTKKYSWGKIHYWCQDETRIGLKTITGKLIPACGVKPVGLYQWLFQYLWLYGLVEPKTGDSFFYEFSHLDTPCFEKFLEIFSQKYPDEVHII